MQTIALISQSALNHNFSLIRNIARKQKIVSMVKANAYGHGINMVKTIIDKSDIVAVSELKEALKLRLITDKPILLLSGIYSKQELQKAIKLNCIIVVHNDEQIKLVNNTKQKVNIWIKIDTGMHRLGLSEQQYNKCLNLFSNNSLINPECIMSHFACADEVDNMMNKAQLDIFNNLTNNKIKRSMSNSASILSNKNSLYDFVRPGIILYGISPFANKIEQKLKPVMQLKSPIMAIKTVKKGESVGYGAIWIATKTTTIAIVGIGYGDGYPRHAKNNTPVLINNTICPLIGRVSMDLICVNIGNTKAKVGDYAILWGDEKLRIETVAKFSDTIAYQLVTSISSRVKFIKAA